MLDSAFQYSSLYNHAASGLSMSSTRFYAASTARWLNRDLAGESAGTNLFAYVNNNPISVSDPTGLGDDIQTPGGYVVDPTRINCIGYTSGLGMYANYGTNPDGSYQSPNQFLSALGLSCHPVAKAEDCKCPKDQTKVLFFSDVSFDQPWSPASATAPYHSIANTCDGPSGWKQIAGPQSMGTNPTSTYPGDWASSYKFIFCCCNKKKPCKTPPK